MFAKGGREQKREGARESAREMGAGRQPLWFFFSCTYTQLVRIISTNLYRAQSRPPPRHALAPLCWATPGGFPIWEAWLQGELKPVPSSPLTRSSAVCTGVCVSMPVYGFCGHTRAPRWAVGRRLELLVSSLPKQGSGHNKKGNVTKAHANSLSLFLLPGLQVGGQKEL